MNEIHLDGCTPVPLAGYLKSLGILRLLSVRDRGLRAAWREDHFVIGTDLDREDVMRFFLEHYEPTPVVAPWNGGSGFFKTTSDKALRAIGEGRATRLQAYRETLAISESVLHGYDRSASPKGNAKHQLLVRLRGRLPDDALAWFDAAVVLVGAEVEFPRLLGSGGNDGRLDFTNNFMQRIVDVMNVDTGQPTPAAVGWLGNALFGSLTASLQKSPIGQFSPGRVGGPNSTVGFDENGRINPWDYILMIEGALVFASAAVRRHASDSKGAPSFPFTVHATAAGAGHLGAGDGSAGRGELWMPLWSRPASFPEIRTLFSEGRVALGRRPAHDGLDFVRAVHRLGVYRGIDGFQRFAILKRSGTNHLATPLQRVRVFAHPQAAWIDELEKGNWLSRFQRFARGDKPPARFIHLRKRLDDALFELASSTARPASVQTILRLLAKIQFSIGESSRASEKVGPVPLLSSQWAGGADDGSTAFRLARALAALGSVGRQNLPIRAHLYPIHPRYHGWLHAVCKNLRGDDPGCRHRLTTPFRGSLTRALIRMLQRRLLLQESFRLTGDLVGAPVGVDEADVTAFLRTDDMDGHIETLLPALALCRQFGETEQLTSTRASVPAAYGLLKLTLTPPQWLESVAGLAKGTNVLPSRNVLAQLASNDPGREAAAMQCVWRRLRGGGLSPIIPYSQCPRAVGFSPERLAAATVIPLNYSATRRLARDLLAPSLIVGGAP